MIELAEVQGGLITPTVLAEPENNYQNYKDETSQKCSCNWELNNMCSSDHCDYPKPMAIRNGMHPPMKKQRAPKLDDESLKDCELN